MHPSVRYLGVALLALAGCESDQSPATAPVPVPSLSRDGQPAHENYRVPISRTVSNPCPPVPEPVAIEGYLHYNAHFKFFEGGNSPKLKSNTHGSGVGLVTGVKYQFHELGTVRGTYTYESGRLETERWIRSHLISQTGLGNFFMTTRVRQVCTPEGCQEEIVSIETDCRG